MKELENSINRLYNLLDPRTGTNDPIRIDEVSDLVTYVGYGAPGESESAANWKIKRITATNASGFAGVIKIEWADGNLKYDNIWANRASLIYL